MKFYINENELRNNTQFKIVQSDEDEFEILATYQNQLIAKLNLDIMIGMFDYYFDGDFTEEEYDELFPDDATTFISWVEVYNDIHKGNGIARQLMNMAIQKTKQLGFNRIYLNASPIKSDKSLNLNDLINFYESFGFKIIKHQGHNAQMILILDNINESKTYIKQQLRLITEGVKYATKRDYYRTIARINKVKELYGDDPYFQNIQAGQMIANAIVNIHGYINISTNIAKAGDVRNLQPSTMKENPFYLTFQVNAGRGIEHPDTFSSNIQPAQSRNLDDEDINQDSFVLQLPDGISLETGETSLRIGIPKPGSPASDAAIKTYLIYGDVIKDFVERNLKNQIGYKDGKAPEIANANMSQEDKVKKLHKDLLLRLKKPRIQPSEWENFLRALRMSGIDLQNLNITKDLATDEQWNEVLKRARLTPTQIPDDEKAYQEKIAKMNALKANINRRK